MDASRLNATTGAPVATGADNRRLGLRLTVVAVGMFAFGYALVPFYDRICQALGVNNLSGAVAAVPGNTQVDRARSVTVEFDGNAHELPWRFRPLETQLTLHPGELGRVEYEVVNVRDHAVTGQAIPSFGPQIAGEYFHKLDCFCFTQQTLGPGETRRMPIVFTVDPKLPKDVRTITLSYTFFEIAGRGGVK